MTNITLSIEDSTYKKMKEYSEIKWSEFVRKAIKKRIEMLEKLDISRESYEIMAASEESLKESWDDPLDDRWNYV